MESQREHTLLEMISSEDLCGRYYMEYTDGSDECVEYDPENGLAKYIAQSPFQNVQLMVEGIGSDQQMKFYATFDGIQCVINIDHYGDIAVCNEATNAFAYYFNDEEDLFHFINLPVMSYPILGTTLWELFTNFHGEQKRFARVIKKFTTHADEQIGTPNLFDLFQD